MNKNLQQTTAGLHRKLQNLEQMYYQLATYLVNLVEKPVLGSYEGIFDNIKVELESLFVDVESIENYGQERTCEELFEALEKLEGELRKEEKLKEVDLCETIKRFLVISDEKSLRTEIEVLKERLINEEEKSKLEIKRLKKELGENTKNVLEVEKKEKIFEEQNEELLKITKELQKAKININSLKENFQGSSLTPSKRNNLYDKYKPKESSTATQITQNPILSINRSERRKISQIWQKLQEVTEERNELLLEKEKESIKLSLKEDHNQLEILQKLTNSLQGRVTYLSTLSSKLISQSQRAERAVLNRERNYEKHTKAAEVTRNKLGEVIHSIEQSSLKPLIKTSKRKKKELSLPNSSNRQKKDHLFKSFDEKTRKLEESSCEESLNRGLISEKKEVIQDLLNQFSIETSDRLQAIVKHLKGLEKKENRLRQIFTHKLSQNLQEILSLGESFTEMSEIKRQLKQVTEHKDHLEFTLNQHEMLHSRQVEDFVYTIDQLEIAKKELNEKIDELNSVKSMLEERIANFESREIHNAISTAEKEKKKELERAVAETRNELQGKEMEVKQMMFEYVSTKEYNNQLISENESLEETLLKVEEEYEKKLRLANSKIEELLMKNVNIPDNQKLDSEIEELKNKLEEKAELVLELRGEWEKVKEENRKLEEECEIMKKKLEEVIEDEKLDEALAVIIEKEGLISELEEKIAENDYLEEKLKELEKLKLEYESLKIEKTNLLINIESFEKEKEVYEVYEIEKEKELQELREEIEKFKSLNKELKEIESRLVAKNENLETEIKTTNITIASKTETIEELTKELEEAIKSIESLSESVGNEQANSNIQELSEKNIKLEAQNKTLKLDQSRTLNELTEISTKLELSTKENEIKEKELIELQKANSSSKIELEVCFQKIKKLEEDLIVSQSETNMKLDEKQTQIDELLIKIEEISEQSNNSSNERPPTIEINPESSIESLQDQSIFSIFAANKFWSLFELDESYIWKEVTPFAIPSPLEESLNYLNQNLPSESDLDLIKEIAAYLPELSFDEKSYVESEPDVADTLVRLKSQKEKNRLNSNLIAILKKEIITLESKLKESAALDTDYLTTSLLNFLKSVPILAPEVEAMVPVILGLVQCPPEKVAELEQARSKRKKGLFSKFSKR